MPVDYGASVTLLEPPAGSHIRLAAPFPPDGTSLRFLHLNTGKCSVTLNHASPSGRPLPIQVLLNNLLYDVSEIAVPFDRVDPEATARPVKWDVKLIERFMLVFGPVSSVFDFLTFYALLHLFGAGEGLFQTGWFIESITTQVLVVFAIRTRRRFFWSKPHPFLVAMAFGAVAIATVLLLLPVGQWFDLAAPPPLFFVFLASATVAYLGLVEITKGLFYRYTA